jgi:hypothetical protein
MAEARQHQVRVEQIAAHRAQLHCQSGVDTPWRLRRIVSRVTGPGESTYTIPGNIPSTIIVSSPKPDLPVISSVSMALRAVWL